MRDEKKLAPVEAAGEEQGTFPVVLLRGDAPVDPRLLDDWGAQARRGHHLEVAAAGLGTAALGALVLTVHPEVWGAVVVAELAFALPFLAAAHGLERVLTGAEETTPGARLASVAARIPGAAGIVAIQLAVLGAAWGVAAATLGAAAAEQGLLMALLPGSGLLALHLCLALHEQVLGGRGPGEAALHGLRNMVGLGRGRGSLGLPLKAALVTFGTAVPVAMWSGCALAMTMPGFNDNTGEMTAPPLGPAGAFVLACVLGVPMLVSGATRIGLLYAARLAAEERLLPGATPGQLPEATPADPPAG